MWKVARCLIFWEKYGDGRGEGKQERWILVAGSERSGNFGMRKRGASNLEHVLGFFRLHKALSTVRFGHFGGNQP